MSRSWCTSLEERIVAEYLDGILNKKPRPPKSPYEISMRPPSSTSSRPPTAHRPPSSANNRPLSVHRPPSVHRPSSSHHRSPSSQRPRSAARVKTAVRPVSASSGETGRPTTSCSVKKGGSVKSCSLKSNGSDGMGSNSSLNSSQLSIYSTNIQSSGGRRPSTNKKMIKRVMLYNGPEQFKIIVASSHSDLLERCRSEQVFTSDGTLITAPLYHLLPHNCHIFTHNPLETVASMQADKPKIVWTKNGISVSGTKTKKRPTKPHLSNRLQGLLEDRKHRVQVFRNGEYRTAGSVHISEGKMKVMLQDAANMLSGPVSAFYTVEGVKMSEGDPLPHIITTSHARGPLWAARGNDSFSFIGAYHWCKEELKSVRKEIKLSQQRLSKAYVDELEDDKMTQIKDKLAQQEEICKNLGDIIVNISNDVLQEEDEGSKFKVKNMPEIKQSSRLIGRPNIKVNVFVNGKDLEAKTVVIPGGTFRPTTNWFLEESQKAHKNSLGVTTQKASVIYDSAGKSVTNIDALEPDSCVYLSFGEAFTKPVIRTFLQVAIHGVTAHRFPDSDRFLVEKRMMEDEETADPLKKFTPSFGIPQSYKASEALLKQKLKTLKIMVNDMSARQVFDDNLFLQHKKIKNRIVYPCLQRNIKEAAQKSGQQTLMSGSQTWIYTKNHEIKLKSFPKLSLAVSNHSVVHKAGSGTVEGYMVALSAELKTSWEATSDGNLICSRTGLLLTALDEPAELFVPSLNIEAAAAAVPIRRVTRESGTTEEGSFEIHGQASDEIAVSFPEVAKGEEPFIVALPRLESSKESQRWAFKQENIALLGQWKLCDIANTEWARECLTWPVNSDGNLNTELSWPLEGLLMSNAPSLREVKSPTKAPSLSTPAALRLNVRYNGSCEPARHVTAPDLSNMKKDLAIKRRSFDNKRMDRQPDTQRWLEKHSKGHTEVEDQEKVLELEFRLFLDKCGSVLGLNSLPTRMFTASGEELISLASLERDDDVYVSCGADFDPPDGEKNARNKLLFDISHDVDKLKTFCSAIAPTTYVVSVSEVKRHATVRLQILTDSEVCQLNETDSMSDILQIVEMNKSIEDKSDSNLDDSNDSLDPYHLKSHVCQNETDLEMIEQYPWRNPAFTAGLVKDKYDWQRAHSSGESESESDVESLKSIKSNSSTSSSKARKKGRVFNQWLYKDCRFFLLENPQYVLCAGVDNEVELVVYDKNSAQQCWTVDEEFIYSSNGQCLTVTQCSVNPPDPVDHTGSKLKIAPFQAVTNGNTHQKWEYDQSTGHLKAFAGTPLCSSISAALQAKICTFSVTSSENAEQPTFIMENPGISGIPDDNTHIYVCGSCATSLRDRYSVEKIETTTFVCSVGYYCATSSLSMKSSLQALGGLEGLQPGKAFGTLYLWESLLGDLKQQTSLKAIKDVVKQTLQLECPNEGLVLVRCYLNGTGPPRHQGSLFLARSFEEILRKCLIELKPGRPLSRIFLAGGSEVSTFQCLLESKSTDERAPVPYKELFVSAGEGFIRPQKPRGIPSLKKRLKMYRKLNKLDVSSLQSACSSRGMSRPPHLPAGNLKNALPVYITRNGDFTGGAVRVVAHNLNSLLETATSRLHLPLAARRVFSSSGVEVVTWSEVVRDQALVISTGEAFVRKEKRSKWIHRKVENEK